MRDGCRRCRSLVVIVPWCFHPLFACFFGFWSPLDNLFPHIQLQSVSLIPAFHSSTPLHGTFLLVLRTTYLHERHIALSSPREYLDKVLNINSRQLQFILLRSSSLSLSLISRGKRKRAASTKIAPLTNGHFTSGIPSHRVCILPKKEIHGVHPTRVHFSPYSVP